MVDDEDSVSKRLDRPVLDTISVADLQNYIVELQVEIRRVESTISLKQNARGHANSFFKT